MALNERNAPKDPFILFTQWYAMSQTLGLSEPTAMTVVTVDTAGQPSARVVLLKEYDSRGFVFFTNYNSRKGSDICDNAKCALLFYWGPVARQIRIEGVIEKVDPAESDTYFATRPRNSQLGAWASPQSQPIENRRQLTDQFEELRQKYEGRPIPRPPHWGGYRVVPTVMEFWQGMPDRLHDRLQYDVLASGEWSMKRLAP
ncbi:MAG: pyridoxamine 5'-phosphate oxidase [Pseudomonadota bacterium]|nr:pyridoxamine 5'-phosphate oxidase [Pseudomonadota bacterium]